MSIAQEIVERVSRDGFAVVERVIAPSQISRLKSSLARTETSGAVRSRNGTYAIRNLLDVCPAVRITASSPSIREMVEPILGPGAFPLRGILFDKTPRANWKVPWHQDLSIAVEKRIDAPGFGPWSIKAGVVHVQPPVEVLGTILALRLHLDDCGELNGPLRVIPGSHRLGRLSAEDVRNCRQARDSISCPVGAGGVLLMRPLLLHASSASRFPCHRRVIHLEFAAQELPYGLDWYSGPSLQ